MTKKYCSLVFIHDYDDESGMVKRFLNNFEITEAEMIKHLAQWDQGGESEYCESPEGELPWGNNDSTFYQGNYVLSWDVGLGYVSLSRIIEEEPDTIVTQIIEPLILTPWEAEQAARMMRHCKDIGDTLADGNSNSYARAIENIIKKIEKYVKESA